MSTTVEFAAESRVPQILLGTIIPSAIATIFVFARLYSRAFITRGLGADDAWISISWVAGLTVTVLNCVFTNYGSGHHQVFLTAADAAISAKMSYVARLFYQFVLCTTKLGICSFYLRVFQDRLSKILIYSLMGFVVLYSVPLEIYVLVQCRPEGVVAGNPLACDKSSPDIYMSAILNIVADALLLAFIVPRIIPLKMAIRQKAALLAVVCLGGLVIVAAIVRLTQVLQFNLSKDRTWDFANITTWSAVEVDTGLFCASAPAIKPLIRKLTPGIFSSTDGSHTEPSRNQRRSDYAAGTQRSRIRGMDDAFELSSQTDLNVSKNMGRVTNKVWRGDEESKGTHWDDSTSEDNVLETSQGKIVKTVSVTVTNIKDHSKVSMERENSVVRFEPI